MRSPIRSRQLQGLRVLDLGPGIAPALCARLLADRGADVVKVEPPQGDAVRGLEPRLPIEDAAEQSLVHHFVNWNKRGVVLDLEDPDGRAALADLVRQADVVIHGSSPRDAKRLGIDFDSIVRLHPGIVLTSITGYGQTGPKSDRRWTDLINYAQSGIMSFSGTADREPLRHGCSQSEFSGALAALVPTLAAIYQQRRGGGGRHVDVSLSEALTSHLVIGIPYVTYMDEVPDRRDPAGDSFGNCYPAADGWVIAHSPRSGRWSDFASFVGEPALDDPRFSTGLSRMENAEELDRLLGAALAKRDRFELFHEANRNKILFGVVQSPKDLADCPQLASRACYETVHHPVAGDLRFPVTAFALEEGQQVVASPAPTLGQHQAEVRRDWAGREPDAGRRAGQERPLAGVRVLDASHVFAVPYAASMLAELGADVVRVQPPDRVDTMTSWGPYPENVPGERYWDRVGSLNTVNKSKRALSLDLKDPRGKQIFLDLIERSDVLLESFTPGVLERLGLGDDVLRERNPDLVIFSNSGFGRTGPWSSYGSVATSLEGTSGTCWVSGYEGGWPSKIGQSYTDFLAAWSAASSIIAALAADENLPTERRLDQSMYQLGAAAIGPWIADVFATERVAGRHGNADPDMAPHGVFQTRGDDRWLAIAVDSDAAWQALCEVVPLDVESDWATTSGRLLGQERIHASLAAAIRDLDGDELEERLQAAGVPAGMVLDCGELLEDEHLAARRFFEVLTHPESSGIGSRAYIGRPWRLSDVSLAATGPAPAFGQHNHELLSELGIAEEEQALLTDEGVTPPAPLIGSRRCAPLAIDELRARHRIKTKTSVMRRTVG